MMLGLWVAMTWLHDPCLRMADPMDTCGDPVCGCAGACLGRVE